MGVGVSWVSVFLDLEAAAWERSSSFWSAVTGYAVSPARGADGEHTSLVPPTGDVFVKVQRLGNGPGRVHVDLHVADPAAASDEAVDLGASVVSRHTDYVVLSSPAGVTFCLVDHPASVRPPPGDWGGHRSLVDQLTLDVPAELHDAEVEFWTTLTGWERRASSSPSMAAFAFAPGLPLRLMVQRVGDDRSPATAHLDLSCDDRAAETARHVALGATVLRTEHFFTGMQDPAGAAYCLTDRDPDTGLLPLR